MAADTGQIIQSATFGYGLTRDARIKEKVERMLTIARGIVDMIRAHGVTRVGIENFAFHSVGAQNDLGELQGIVKSQLWLAHRIEPVLVAISSGRKRVLGKGNFKKTEKKLILALVNAMGRGTVANHNEADALVVAEYVRLLAAKGDDDGTEKQKGRRAGGRGGSRRGKPRGKRAG